MQVRVKETGAVMQEHEFRAMHPNVSGPMDDLYDVVFEGPQAATTSPYQFSYRDGVEQKSDGKWYTKYSVGPVFTDRPAEDDKPAQTAAEQEAAYKAAKDAEQAKAVRAQRDAKLAATDWVVIKATETGTPMPADVAAERQWLRDVPTQAGFPWDVKWSADAA